MSDLHSVKAPDETPTETERKVRTYRVLKYNDRFCDTSGDLSWDEVGELENPYIPDATAVGRAFGEGDYLLIEKDSKYSFMSTYEMRVVADRVYRLADDETA